MAIYHNSAKIISRSSGRSSVAAAAYRSGQDITNERDGVRHDYRNKDGVIHSEIVAPENAPEWATDRSKLWNEVEKIEKNKDSQLAREIEVALPAELNHAQQIELMREYSKSFAAQGMVCDWSIHDKRDGNPHAHMMLTMRPFQPDGSWGAKSRKEYITNEQGERIKLKSGEWKSRKIDTTDWNQEATLKKWREDWATITNKHLERAGQDARIDHRSYEDQGIDKTPSVHVGVAAAAMEKKGVQTERGNINREIQEINAMKAKSAELAALEQNAPRFYEKGHEEWKAAAAAAVGPITEQAAAQQQPPKAPESAQEAPKIEEKTKAQIGFKKRNKGRINTTAAEAAKRTRERIEVLKSATSRLEALNKDLEKREFERREPYIKEIAQQVIDKRYEAERAVHTRNVIQFNRDYEEHCGKSFFYKATHSGEYNRNATALTERREQIERTQKSIEQRYSSDLNSAKRGQDVAVNRAADILGVERRGENYIFERRTHDEERLLNNKHISCIQGQLKNLSEVARRYEKLPKNSEVSLPSGGGGSGGSSVNDALNRTGLLAMLAGALDGSKIAAVNFKFDIEDEIDWAALTPEQVQDAIAKIANERD